MTDLFGKIEIPMRIFKGISYLLLWNLRSDIVDTDSPSVSCQIRLLLEKVQG